MEKVTKVQMELKEVKEKTELLEIKVHKEVEVFKDQQDQLADPVQRDQ